MKTPHSTNWSKIRRNYGGKLPVALNSLKEYIQPDNGLHGICPECGEKVISRMSRKFDEWGNPKMRKHFAHLKSNEQCPIHLRNVGRWELRQKSVFPVSWCQTAIIHEEGGTQKHKLIDVFSPTSKDIIEFERDLNSPSVASLDQFFSTCKARTSWIFKSTLSDVKRKLEIIELKESNLSDFKARQQPDAYYKQRIDGRDSAVLFRGDLSLEEQTTLHGYSFLNLSGKAFLSISPDKLERFPINTQEDWAFGIVHSISDLMGIYRPTFRVDARFGDESALRMVRYIDESSDALREAGGPLKLVGANSSRSVFIPKPNLKESDPVIFIGKPEDLSDIKPEEILKVALAEKSNSQLIYFEDENIDLMEAYIQKLKEVNAWVNSKMIEIDELGQYLDNTYVPEILELTQIHNEEALDLSINKRYGNEIFESNDIEVIARASKLIEEEIVSRQNQILKQKEEEKVQATKLQKSIKRKIKLKGQKPSKEDQVATHERIENMIETSNSLIGKRVFTSYRDYGYGTIIGFVSGYTKIELDKPHEGGAIGIVILDYVEFE